MNKKFREALSSYNDYPLHKLVYWLSYPFFSIFIYFKIKPNTITTLSNLMAVISFFFLFDYFYLFLLFWWLNIILDYCDGLVARTTESFSILGAFYDHFSDVLKILILYLLVAIKYNILEIWILSSLNIIIFSMYVLTHKMQANRQVVLSNLENNNKNIVNDRKSSIFKIFYRTLFLVDSNFMIIWLPLLVINVNFALYIYIVTFLIILKSLIMTILSLYKINVKIEEKKNVKI